MYTCCILSVACNWMSCATCFMQLHKIVVACVACNWMSCAICLMQLHKIVVACVACNWILIAKVSCKTKNF
jgi:hypothetical protein